MQSKLIQKEGPRTFAVVLDTGDEVTDCLLRVANEHGLTAASFTGLGALSGGEPELHPHIVVGKSDGTAWGGHLLEGIVRPTLEVVITETPAHLHRKSDPETGLALLEL